MKRWAWLDVLRAPKPVCVRDMVTRTVGDISISEPATHSLALTIIREQKAENADLRRRLDTWMRIAEGATRDRRVAEEYNRRMGARIIELEDKARAREPVVRNLEAAHREGAQEIDRLRARLARTPKGRRR